MDGGMAWYGKDGFTIRFSKYERNAVRPYGRSVPITEQFYTGASRSGKTAALEQEVRQMAKRRTKVSSKSLAERVARLEAELRESKPDVFRSVFFSETLADKVRRLQARVLELECRLGDQGEPKFKFEVELTCGKVVFVVARNVEEALVKGQKFLTKEEHEGGIVGVRKTSVDPVDVC